MSFEVSQYHHQDIVHISPCIINFYGRTELLKNILSSLAQQDIEKKRFEVVLVEDRGGTKEGKNITEEYGEILNIHYITLKQLYLSLR